MLDSPLCDIVQHSTCDRAFLWRCNDYSDQASGNIEHYSCKFKTVEDAHSFRDAFIAARTFANLVREEKFDELIYAPLWQASDEQ